MYRGQQWMRLEAKRDVSASPYHVRSYILYGKVKRSSDIAGPMSMPHGIGRCLGVLCPVGE
jgi:hypothetical protein